MWGNTLGWSISAVIVACMLWGVHVINQAGRISPPTSFATDPAHLATVALPVSPQTVMTFTDSTDSAPTYREAIAEYQSHRAAYDAFGETGKLQDIPKLPALDSLVRAAPSSKARLFSAHPEEIVVYVKPRPALDALRALGKLCVRAGLLTQKSDSAAATKYHEAAFSLGMKLFDERLTSEEMLAGLELMSEGAAGLSRISQANEDRPRAAAIASFDLARKDYYNNQILPMLTVLTSVDGHTVAEHAGDYFWLAKNADDRVWRVESIFALGRLRFFVGPDGRVGDQLGASKQLKQLADDSDPVIRAAAIAGRDLTIEEYRQIR
jgi:hypothetical protein